MAPFPKTLKELCTPALLYFIISIISLVVLLFQNLGDNNSYNVGTYSCQVPNTAVLFVFKLVYILFWTYVLNLICKDGHSTISWLLVLFPFILLFIIIGIFMLMNIHVHL
jgi:hypothetical protein